MQSGFDSRCGRQGIKMKIITRKLGIWLMIIGFAMQFINYFTYTYWQIDIDIPGAFIFIIGLVITIFWWKNTASNKKISRRK